MPTIRQYDIASAMRRIREFQIEPPIHVEKLAESFGLRVWTFDFPNDISGSIRKDVTNGGPVGYSILVNASHPLTRKRFTVGHEIGHYLLHRDKIGDGLEDDALYRSGLSTLEEVQANRMAAEILMPYALIDEAIKGGKKTIAELAQLFVVSKEAMSIRLEVPQVAS